MCRELTVSNKIPDSIVSVELHSETSWISYSVGTTTLTPDSAEANSDRLMMTKTFNKNSINEFNMR